MYRKQHQLEKPDRLLQRCDSTTSSNMCQETRFHIRTLWVGCISTRYKKRKKSVLIRMRSSSQRRRQSSWTTSKTTLNRIDLFKRSSSGYKTVIRDNAQKLNQTLRRKPRPWKFEKASSIGALYLEIKKKNVDDAHKTHPGKQAIEKVLRMVVCWASISQDVEWLVSSCDFCQKIRPSLGKTVSKWPEADKWERIQRTGPTSKSKEK